MMTASKAGGRGWPVLTNTKSAPGARRTGAPSRAAKVSAARTAIPSMAALWKVGEEWRATTGSAVIRPAAYSAPMRSTPSRAFRSSWAMTRESASSMGMVRR